MSAAVGHPQPPAHVRPYVDALGVDRAVAFLLRHGGGPAALSARPGAGSSVAETIGAEGVAALRAVYGERIDDVPLAGAWIAAVLQGRGVAVVEIARRLRTTDATVRRWLRAARAAEAAAEAAKRQMSLLL